MIRKFEEMRVEKIQSMRDGKGEVEVIHILEKNEFQNKGRLFARNILKPGTSVGLHEHINDFEVYYIVKGEGIFSDNGVQVRLNSGDMGYTKNGHSHSIENVGDCDLEFIALVLYD